MAVHLLLTTIPANWHSLDPTIHLDRSICKRNFNAIKHAKWIDEVCIHPSNKVLVRLLKDLRQRFPGLEALNPWLINLLAHHCVTNNNNSSEQLPPSYAFKYRIQRSIDKTIFFRLFLDELYNFYLADYFYLVPMVYTIHSMMQISIHLDHNHL